MVEQGATWREDPTNASPRYLRNALRTRVLPVLEELRPGAVRAMARSARLAAEDADLLDRLAVHPPALTLTWARATPEPLVRRVLSRLISEPTAGRLDAILAIVRRGSGVVHLSALETVRIEGDEVRVVHGARASGPLE
jgi:tRNA(Ile)-lysidine synthase